MLYLELDGQVKREQYRDAIAAAAHARLVRAIRGTRSGVTRRAARLLGYALQWVSALLLRYGQVDIRAAIAERDHALLRRVVLLRD